MASDFLTTGLAVAGGAEVAAPKTALIIGLAALAKQRLGMADG